MDGYQPPRRSLCQRILVSFLLLNPVGIEPYSPLTKAFSANFHSSFNVYILSFLDKTVELKLPLHLTFSERDLDGLSNPKELQWPSVEKSYQNIQIQKIL